MIGKTIGGFEITAQLGAGGMGEVYRARDTRLGRDVAIKVLPEAFASDPERLARFEREARLLAGLSHPNIGAIYGLEEADGRSFLVLELVEGEDLSQRLQRGPVPLDDALEIARQVAEALEAAHEQGVIHRDLKPANIQLTPDGTVKVLDFGLAKALDTSPGDSSSELTQSPTVLASSPTVAGVILGTAAYMSPEQARGKRVDRRADIFAFGSVVMEMLTGRTVFSGETVSDTLAAVLRADPGIDDLPSGTPRALRRLLERCLDKDPRTRLRDIGEARVAIDAIRSGADDDAVADAAAGGATAAHRGSRVPGLGWVVVAVVVVVAVLFMLRGTPEVETELPLRKSSIVLSNDDPAVLEAFDPVVSPDGRFVAFVSHRQLWLRDLSAIDARPLPGTEGASKPLWSPDGEWIAYGSGQDLLRVSRSGGTPTLAATLPSGITLGQTARGVWTSDDRIIIGPGTTGLQVVPAQGGECRELLAPGKGESDFHEVGLLPDGRSVVFVVHGEHGYGTLAVLTADGERRDIVALDDNVIDPVYSPSGHILFRRVGGSRGIWAVPFSTDTMEATGDPFLVVAGARRPSVSRDGTLVYTRNVDSPEAQLSWWDRDGNELGVIGEPASVTYPFPALSPDGRSVLLSVNYGGGRDLFLYDVTSGNRRRITFTDDREDIAAWHPNGQEIVFYGADELSIRIRSLGANAQERLIVKGTMGNVTPDGKDLIFARQKEGAWDWDIYRMPLAGGDSTLVIESPGVDWWPQISPDGRILLYVSNESGRDEVYATTYPTPTTRWQVSSNGGAWPRWRADGKEIFYTTFDHFVAVPVQEGEGFALGLPRELYERPRINWSSRWADGFDVTADGRRFVALKMMRSEDTRPPEIVIVQNWFREFEKDE